MSSTITGKALEYDMISRDGYDHYDEDDDIDELDGIGMVRGASLPELVFTHLAYELRREFL